MSHPERITLRRDPPYRAALDKFLKAEEILVPSDQLASVIHVIRHFQRTDPERLVGLMHDFQTILRQKLETTRDRKERQWLFDELSLVTVFLAGYKLGQESGPNHR